ncbi:MAG: hypothetical protein ACRCT8_15040 [Lacipirellulaceae bacterium]
MVRCFVAIAIFAAVGCGRTDWGYVAGAVTVDGQAVGPGTLVFEPTDPKNLNGPSSLGYFGEDGRYELLSVGKVRGAVAGEYRVVIMPGAPGALSDENTKLKDVKTSIPAKYFDYGAGLTATVTPGSQSIDFPLTK